MGRGREPLPGHAQLVFRTEPGTSAPPRRQGRARPAGSPHADVARLSQRPDGPVPAGALRSVGVRRGPADEHRRRGRRDRDQDGAQVGIPGARGPGRPGRDHRVRGQLPRTHDHHRRLLFRRAVPRGLRSVHPGIQAGAVRRHRRAQAGDRAQHRRLHGRAHPGRGRGGRPARRLPARDGGDLPRQRRCVRGRRDPDGAGPYGPVLLL